MAEDIAALEGKKVLVVDDEPDIVTYLCTLLGDHGMVTCTAADGEEGLAVARAEKPDVITLDISMPETSGVRMFRNIQSDPDLEGIPVVIVTGLSRDFEGFIHSRRQVRPPDGYIAKPLDADEVLGTLARVITARAEVSDK